MAIGGVELTALTTLTGLFVWYLKNQTVQQAKREKDSYIERTDRQDKRDKEQKEEREYYRSLVENNLKELHSDNIKNVELNAKGIELQKNGIELQKNVAENLELHSATTIKFSEKVLGAFDILCDRMNGGSPNSIALKKKLKEYEKKGIIINRRIKNKSVKVNKRK